MSEDLKQMTTLDIIELKKHLRFEQRSLERRGRSNTKDQRQRLKELRKQLHLIESEIIRRHQQLEPF